MQRRRFTSLSCARHASRLKSFGRRTAAPWSAGSSRSSHRGSRQQMPGDQVIQRQDAGTTGDEEEKTGRPGSVRRPGGRIGEHFDDEGHHKKGKGRKARCEANNEQNRKDMFADGGEIGCDGRIDEAELVLLAEEKDRTVVQFPAIDLGLAGLPEDGRWK